MRAIPPERRSMAFADWPAPDQRALVAALEPGGLFSDPGPGAHWAAATRVRYEKSWGYFLSFLKYRNLLRPDDAPARRASPELVQAWIDHLIQHQSPQSVVTLIEAIHNLLLAIASDEDWVWLTRMLRRLRARAAARLIPPDQLRPIDEIYAAGLQLTRLAESRRWHRPLVDSTMFRDGLMLPLLCVTLFRLKNFAGLRLDRHLMRHGDVVKLEIPPEEVKNGKRLERVIPPEVVALLDRYLEHHRPRLLLGRRSPALWITEYGTDASPGVVPIAFAKRPSVSWACGSRRTGSAIAPPPVSPRPGPNSRP